jgi:glutathione peroxidase
MSNGFDVGHRDRAALAVLAGALLSMACSKATSPVMDHVVKDIDGNEVSLASYRGRALLIVNVASECGFTPQYESLEQLYRRYRDRGLVVLGFPSNDFGGQEPGSCDVIKKFAHEQYNVTFPLFDKVHARGEEIAPLYRALTQEVEENLRGPVKWNFEKFVVDKQGRVIARFPSKVGPLDAQLVAAVERALK